MQISLPSPTKKQSLFLKCNARHIGFGGARGGGKSMGIRLKAIILAGKYPGIKIMIVRKTYPELIANHIKPLKEMLWVGNNGGLCTYNDSRKEIRFANGSEILFRYCSCDSDLDRFQGTECDILFLDEATQFTEEQIKKINACVRGVNSYPKHTFYTMNPGGVGHGYIKRIFIDRQYIDGENPDDYVFIQSLVTDNEPLMASNPNYIKDLESLPYVIREAWLHGRWDVFEGAYFSEFRTEPDMVKCAEQGLTKEEALKERRWTHVIEPFDIPSHWKCYLSYDWGYGKPFSFAWTFLDEYDRAYRAIELYGCTRTPNEGVKWTNIEQFTKAAELMREHPWLKGRKIQAVADPSIWDGSHGISVEQDAEKCGIYFDKGINDRIPGWLQVRERLKFDENGFPKLYFFNTCKAIIRTMPLMMFDEHKVEDLDSTLEDHACDELRYFCMANYIAPKIEQTVYKPMLDPLNQYANLKQNNIIRRY